MKANMFHNDLTRSQYDTMCDLNPHVGKTVDVQTSQYDNGINPEFLKRKVGGFQSASTLRALERKGYIKIVDSYWRGATVTVLKGLNG